MTKELQWDVQSLGLRIQKAAAVEEDSIQTKSKAASQAAHEDEIRRIAEDIRALLIRIEDAIPMITLAITTSGASLTTQLPASVSPSRLLQASTYLSIGDKKYSESPNLEVQVGPTFTLSLYMLFAGHANRTRPDHDIESMRDTTWKEVIHKARVKLVRYPKQSSNPGTPLIHSVEDTSEPLGPGEGGATQYTYRFDIIEDLDDDRVHSFEDDEAQPGPYQDIALAGIREQLPIYQISKIFYADTGKILNIGNADEPSSPVLLLKRDINALAPTTMMREEEKSNGWGDEQDIGAVPEEGGEEGYESQDDIDQQLRRESSVHLATERVNDIPPVDTDAWKFPADLDPEWLAFEVYTESEDSETEDGEDGEANDDSAYASHRPSSSGQSLSENSLVAGLSDLDINHSSPPPLTSSQIITSSSTSAPSPRPSVPPHATPFGALRFTSLSTLEMLIRLASLQQFKQQSHLVIPDELLSFFLQESSATGAGGDEKARRRTRREAVEKVGFDPYNDSPMKSRGENYQYQHQSGAQGYDGYRGSSRSGTPIGEWEPDRRGSRGGTPYAYEEYEHQPQGSYDVLSPRWNGERSTPQGTPEPWLLRDREHSSPGPSRRGTPSSPVSPYRPVVRQGKARPLDRVRMERERGLGKTGSPLGRGVSVETDSSLGTSPGMPLGEKS